MTDPHLEQQIALSQRPQGRWTVMRQTWKHLLFLHWAVDPKALAPTLPEGLHLQTFEGRAWLGIVPFFMRDIRPVGCPSIPGISHFLEMNLRTYVTDDQGQPGVWFYSLDANQSLAVKVARRFFHLPYEHARMEASIDDQGIDYRSHRKDCDAQSASRFHYLPKGAIEEAQPGTLDYFLLERYLLFAKRPRDGRLYSGRVHHTPYPVQKVEVSLWDANLIALNGLDSPLASFDHAAYSPGVKVDVYRLESLD